MGGPIPSAPTVVDDEQYYNTASQVPQSTWNVMGAAFQEALTDNPLSAIYRMSEMANLTMDGEETGDLIGKEEFDGRYASLGLEWDNRMTWAGAQELGARKVREQQNQFIMGRGQGGFVEGSAVIGSSLVASFLDPLNVALAFLPIVSAPKYAQLGLKSGSRLGQFMSKGLFKAEGLVSRANGGSTWARLQIGAIDGFAGSLLVEPISAIARTQEQADYTSTHFLHNVMIGTLMGSGLHAGIGKIGDLYSAHGMRKIEADIRETESAAKQLLDGKQVDTAGLHAMHEAEITRLNDGIDVDSGSIQSDIDARSLDLGQLPEVTIVTKEKTGVVVRFADDAGEGLTAFGSNIEKARGNLIREYQRLKIEERATVVKRDAATLQNKLQSLVSKRNHLQKSLKSKASPDDIAALQDMKDRLKRLNSPDALDMKLRENGQPVDAIKILDEKLASLDRMRKGIKRGSKRKLPKISEEETALRIQRKEAIDRMDQGKFVETKDALRLEKDTLRRQIKKAEATIDPKLAKSNLKKVHKEIDNTMKDIEKTAIQRTQETLNHQKNAEGQLFFTPRPDEVTMRDAEATTRANDLGEVERSIKVVDDVIGDDVFVGLPPELRKAMEDSKAAGQFVDKASEAQLKGLKCMLGFSRGK